MKAQSTLQRIAFICCLFAVGAIAAAQDLPIDEKGLKPFGTYLGGNLDSISMSNGSLTLHIPVLVISPTWWETPCQLLHELHQ